MPDSHLIHRRCDRVPPVAVGGEGVWLIDSAGRRYLDGSGGAAVSCLGHGDAEVTAAVKAQLDALAFAHTGFLTSPPAEALGALLAECAPEGIERAFLVSGGSEAVEAAIKLARQYFTEIGQPQRSRVIARRQSYHGNTLGALAAGGNAWRRAQFDPLLVETSHIAPCYAYREQREGETLEEYGLRAAEELETEIQRLGPDSVMAFIAEPVVGATLGAVPAAPGYLKRIREICDRHGVLLILDEVMCGMGRCGTLFACEYEDVTPDIITIAKGLGGGYQPVGAMLCHDRIYGAIADGSGFFQHGHTYLGHPVAAAAGLAVLSAVLERDLVRRSAEMGETLAATLRARFGDHPHIGDIRGRGLFRGLELVEDRTAKTPFDPARGLAGKIKAAAFARGLICYPMGGTIDGRRGDHVLLAPPLIISEDEIGQLVERLDAALSDALAA